VWFVPLIVHLGHRGYVLGSRWALCAVWALCALIAGWLISPRGRAPMPGLVAWRPGGLWNVLLPSGYLLVLLVAILVSAVWLLRQISDSHPAPIDVPSGASTPLADSAPAPTGVGSS
jgi:alpha-1,2-mannosyltransferase